MTKRIMYLCSGRSFRSRDTGRKFGGIIGCWRKMGHEVLHICGGDISSTTTSDSSKKYDGNISHFRKWHQRSVLALPFARSVSEYRDIQHDAALLRHLEKECNSYKPDLIWERSCRLHCSGLTAARHIGVPYVLEWKDNIASYWLSLCRNRARRMERHKNEEADFIVTESEVLRNGLIGQGIRSEKILVAQNAVDPGQFYRDPGAGLQIRTEMGIGSETVLVGYLGSYAWYHDTERLVKAMDVLRGRGVANVRCLMVGAGKEYDRTLSLARKRGLLGNAVLMKPGVPPDEVPRILAALDVAVLPGSTDIICPIKVQEYMAMELATVVPAYPCNQEVIDDGRTGMLFASRDEVALADRMLMLAENPDLRQKMGKLARQEIADRFTWEATWGAALAKVIAKSSPSSH